MTKNNDTRTAKRRLEPAKRKYERAIAIFDSIPDFTNIEHSFDFKPHKDSVEITTHLTYRGERLRFNYEMNLLVRLPRVAVLRDFFWASVKDYTLSLPVH